MQSYLWYKFCVAIGVSGQIDLEGQNQALPDWPLWKSLKHCTHIPTSDQKFQIHFRLTVINYQKTKSQQQFWSNADVGQGGGRVPERCPYVAATYGKQPRWQKVEQWPLACKILDQSPTSGVTGTGHLDFVPSSP